MDNFGFVPDKQEDFGFKVEQGSKDQPVESDIFKNDTNRLKASFADETGLSNILKQNGFEEISKNKEGQVVAKDKSGVWHTDNSEFTKNPINWLESKAGYALPTALNVAGGLTGGLPGAGVGQGAGETLREIIGSQLGVSDISPSNIAKESGMGVVNELGGRAIGAVGSGIAKGSQAIGLTPFLQKNVTTPLQNFAYQRAFKALGPYAKEVRMLYPKIEEIGQQALDSGVITNNPFASPETLAERSGAVKEAAGKAIGEIENKIGGLEARGDIPGIPQEEIANDIANGLIHPNPTFSATKKLNTSYERELKSLLENEGPLLDFNKLRALKEEANTHINWDRPWNSETPMSPKETFYRKAYNALQNAEERRAGDVERAVLGDESNTFNLAKSAYGGAKAMQAVSSKKAAREFANRSVSPTSVGVGAAGAFLESLANPAESMGKKLGLGALIGAGHELIKRHGNQFTAKQLDNLLNQRLISTALENPSYLNPLTRPVASSIWDALGGQPQ